MPNHWESSDRPLFVKTVFINGNRHAILSPSDPLLHPGMSILKKKRPCSSLSIASVLSMTTSESQDSSCEKRTKSLRPEKCYNKDDISSQLQGCLIKLRLASSAKKSVNESKEKIDLCCLKENVKQKKPGEKTDIKHNKKRNLRSCSKNCGQYFEEYEESNNFEERINNCCYVYNFENNKRKKNYCFVKVLSQPSQFILKCSCEENWGKFHNICDSKNCTHWNNNNLVISATFHNLIMNPEANEKTTKSSYNLFHFEKTDTSQTYWNDYLGKTYYNTLSERVFQWLDLSSKKKSSENVGEISTRNSSDKILDKKSLSDENSTIEAIERLKSDTENKIIKIEKNKIQREEADIDVITEVKGEDFVETALSIDKFKNGYVKEQEATSEISNVNQIKPECNQSKKNETIIPTKVDSNLSASFFLKNSIENQLINSNLNSYNVTKTIQNFMLDKKLAENSKNTFSGQNRKKKEKLCTPVKQSKCKEEEENNIVEENEFNMTAIKYWKNRVNKKKEFLHEFESSNELMSLQTGRRLEECVGQMKNQNLKREFEKYKQSIDNLNITQTKSATYNFSSSQHSNKTSSLREGKSVWPGEKDLRKPQLHIFIPSVLLKDAKEDSLSECESISE